MRNPYLVRTAAVASLAAAVLTAGYLGMPSDEMQIAPESIAVSAARLEPAMHFHAGFIIPASVDESDVKVYEYY